MGGVDFALQCFDGEVRPRYLSFLEVLTEFSTKLIKQDKGTVLSYLEQQLPDGQQPQTQDEYWIPYMTYRNTRHLQHHGRLHLDALAQLEHELVHVGRGGDDNE